MTEQGGGGNCSREVCHSMCEVQERGLDLLELLRVVRPTWEGFGDS